MKRHFLKEEHAIFRSSLRKFLEQEAAPYFADWEVNQQIPRSFWKKAGEQGYLCSWAKEAYGGFEADFRYSVVLNEEFERIGTAMVGLGLHNDIVMPYIDTYGSEEQKKRWLPKAIQGEIISAIAMTEPGAGSDLAAIQTTAKKDGDAYIVNGEKTFITNGSSADLVVVVCKTNPHAQPAYKGISLLVVEANTPGFRKGKKLKKMGQHANDTCELIFEDARVPAGNLLGEEGKGFYYLMEKLQQERLLVSMQSVAAIKEMITITSEYVKQRKAFGKRISEFQHTQFQLAELYTEWQIGNVFVDRLIEQHMAGEQIVSEVSMAKWWTTDLAKKVAAICMQLHGGYGYMEEFEIARRYRDVAVSSIYAGSNEIMKLIIAKNMGLVDAE
ncbi:acyl-CoA dehydrogenase [Virgibacillus dokdonensis]|uniref:Acyl-CoA dehydrogenase n=2 Tax=Virgibacillus TaxID=84406 RepID=A0A1M5XK89_9BACI|nr:MULTISPECIES: acyl-CoA dehydrogenase family protein [Virgibacillus]RFA34936.1 acyl-CoA dehydrogenase [Virgibacillus dokdonensis]SHH99934.1 acyl-CoA dehydrogenase [Virgibacillus chiguensis]